MRRRILCFGDSNTWGYIPAGGRFDEAVRWPMRMQAILGDGYIVVEEGLNGRTTASDDPYEGGHKSGAGYLPACLMSHNPLDLVILMLGTNDTKQRFGLNPFMIGQGMGELIKRTRTYGQGPDAAPPKVLLVSPILIGDNIMGTVMGPIFGPDAAAISKGLAEEYRKLALLHKTEFLNAADFARPCAEDAVHMTREQQLALAEAMAEKVRSIFS